MTRQRVGQAGIRGARVAGKYAPFSIGTPVECVVIAVRYIDDPKNVSKAFTEYDCKNLRTGQIFPNVRRMDSEAGMDDGAERILRPAQAMVNAKPSFDPTIDQLSESDGDRVQVTCNYGSMYGAVISAVLPHPRMTYGTTKAQGQRKFETHKGTSVETKQDGTFVITRMGTTITLNADATIDVKHKSGSELKFFDNGNIQETPAPGQKLFFGANNATENLVLGQQLVQMLNTLFNTMLTMTFTTAFGPSGPMLPPAATQISQLQASLNTILSMMSFTTATV